MNKSHYPTGLSDNRKTGRMIRPRLGGSFTNLFLAAMTGIALVSCQGNNGQAVGQKKDNATRLSSEAMVQRGTATIREDTVHMPRVTNTFKPHFYGSQTPRLHYRDSLRYPALFYQDLHFDGMKRRMDSVMKQATRGQKNA